jgi:hypothetical protein
MKLPPYGRELVERLKFNRIPDHVIVCVGLNSWPRANQWCNSPNNVWPLVLPSGDDPRAYKWPVRELLVVVQTECGPTDDQCRELSRVLLAYGAEEVTVHAKDGLNKFNQYVALERVMSYASAS